MGRRGRARSLIVLIPLAVAAAVLALCLLGTAFALLLATTLTVLGLL